MTVEFRPAIAADAAAVTALIDAAYGHYVARIGGPPGPMRQDYRAVIDRGRVTLAIEDGQVAGVVVVAVTPEGFCLENVAVGPGAQGRGLGGELIARAEAEAVAAGHDSIYLYTHELMTENRARYRWLGYVEYERRIEDGLARVFLRKNLAVIARLRAAGCVFAEDEGALLIEAGGDLGAMVERRCAGEPLEHILGWVAFCGLRIAVKPGVFVPRQRTALLVREAARCARPAAVVVDLCCGSGAIGAAIRVAEPTIELHAADVDPAAVACAIRNLGENVYEGDLFDALPSGLRGRVDLLVANVPYVPSDAVALMPPEARDYEPRATLDGGTDGLDLLRRVALAAAAWLAPGGSVLIETSDEQAPIAVEIFAVAGLTARIVADDEIGATAVIGLNRSATIE